MLNYNFTQRKMQIAMRNPGVWGGQQPGKDLPAVEQGVPLIEVILAAVPTHLQLWSSPIPGPIILGHPDAAQDPLQVPLKVQGPLIEGANSHHSLVSHDPVLVPPSLVAKWKSLVEVNQANISL